MTEEIKDVTITRTNTPRLDRDVEGRIIRSKEWLEARIQRLEEKSDDLASRAENVRAELVTRTEQLESLS